MSLIYLVRHGQGTLDGGSYDQLSETGRLQAEMLGHAWVSSGFTVDFAYSGTLNRHRQTAGIVAGQYQSAGLAFPDVQLDERFNEIDSLGIIKEVSVSLAKRDADFRDLLKRTRLAFEQNASEKIRLFNKTYHTIMDAWTSNRCPDFEGLTWEAFSERVLETLHELQRYGDRQRIAVFTSGIPIGVFIGKALNLSRSKTLKVIDHLKNTNVTTLELKEDRLLLISMNETSHLTEDQETLK